MFKNSIFIFVLFTLSVIFISSCTKKPKPCFSLSAETVFTRDTVHYYNCSKNGKSLVWDYGDGSMSNVSNDNTSEHVYTKEGSYVVTLTEHSKSYYNTKKFTTSKSITVLKAVYGCMDPNSFSYNPLANKDDGSCAYLGSKTFYFSNPAYLFVDLNVDSQYLGLDSLCYPSALPDCNLASGCKKVTVGEGAHTYDAIFYDLAGSISKTKHGTFTVTGNACELFLLN